MLKKVLSLVMALALLVGASMSLDVMAQNEKLEALKAQAIEDGVYTSVLSFPEGFDEVAAKKKLAEDHPYTGEPLTEEEIAAQDARLIEIMADDSLTETERDALLAEINIYELKVPEGTSAKVAGEPGEPSKNDVTLYKPTVLYNSSTKEYYINVKWQWTNNNCLYGDGGSGSLYAPFGERYPGKKINDGTYDQVAISFSKLKNASKMARNSGIITYYAGQAFDDVGAGEGQYKRKTLGYSKTSSELAEGSASYGAAIYEFLDESQVVYQKDQGQGDDLGNVWAENYVINYWGWRGNLVVKYDSNFAKVSGEVRAYFVHNYYSCNIKMTGFSVTSSSDGTVSYNPQYSIEEKVKDKVKYTENTQFVNGVS